MLAGPVAVCVDRPLLAVDRPFTYLLSEDVGAGVGSLVQVTFHGRAVRGWVLGPTDDVPERMLPVRKLISRVRFFDEAMLDLLRWVSERYVAPLAAVIARSHPPRVASEEEALGAAFVTPSGTPPSRRADAHEPDLPSVIGAYRGGAGLLDALAGGSGAFALRPAPEEEAAVTAELVGRVLAAGRRVVVLVPEAEPLPATAQALREAFGDRVCLFLGGDRRERYRTWLKVAAGRFEVVVGTRPAVFAPVAGLGLLLVIRESHANHREERSPYHHVRDVALARARLGGAVCVLSALCPSAEVAALGLAEVAPEGRRWPPVEVVRPGPEGRASRLLRALREARRAFLYEPLPGYGIARTCRSCGQPAACAACGGLLRAQAGAVRCVVCGAGGACAACGGRRFGVLRRGAERVEEWARGVARVPVRRALEPTPPGPREVLVGGPEAVKDFGPLGLDLVGILDADLARRRPGLSALERALTTWMEAASWAHPGGHVIVQTEHPNEAAIQSLVAGNPDRFHRAELSRRGAAGFPAGFPVFRVIGRREVADALRGLSPRSLLVSGEDARTVCLLALDPRHVPAFGRAMRELAEADVVERVEAEPHL